MLAILAVLVFPILEIVFRRLKSSPEMRRNWAIFFTGSIVTGIMAYGIAVLDRDWPFPVALILIMVLFVAWLLFYRLKLSRVSSVLSPSGSTPSSDAFAEYKDGVHRMWSRVAGAVKL